MTAEEIKLITDAYLEGKVVEYRSITNYHWREVPKNYINWDFNKYIYRIKIYKLEELDYMTLRNYVTTNLRNLRDDLFNNTYVDIENHLYFKLEGDTMGYTLVEVLELLKLKKKKGDL